MTPIDRDVLLLLNGVIGRSPSAFEGALFLCGQIPLVVCVMALLALWWTDTEGGRNLRILGGGRAPSRLGLLESRCRVAMLSVAIPAAFVVTRLIAYATNLPRPLGRERLLVPIDAVRWNELVQAMTGFGAFPSDHAALFFAVAVGLFAWGRAVGTVGLCVAALFSLARVAVGFHYPSDMFVGAAIGASCALFARWLVPHFTPQLVRLVGLFDRAPALMYPLLFVAALDFTHHFRMLMKQVFSLAYSMLGLAGAA